MRRCVCGVVIGVIVVATHATNAAEVGAPEGQLDSRRTVPTATIVPTARPMPPLFQPAVEPRNNTHEPGRAFLVLASAYAALNALDVYTTADAISSGRGQEANPLLAPFAGNTFALATTKTVLTASSLVLARKIWRRNRAAGLAFLISSNVVTGFVVAHNARVGR